MLEYIRVRGFFQLLSANYFIQFLGFISSLLVAKFLTPVELGEVRILQSYLTLFLILAGFGFNTVVLKFCAEPRTSGDRMGILQHAFTRTLLATTITLAAVFALYRLGWLTSSPRLGLWLFVFSLSIPATVVSNLLLVFLQALKKIASLAKAQAWIKFISVLLVIGGTWRWGFKGFIVASILGGLISLLPPIRMVGVRFLSSKARSIPDRFTRLALFSALANGVNQLGQQGDILILDQFSANREWIGYYSLAVIFLLAANQVTGTVQSIAAPYLSESSMDMAKFRRILLTNQARLFLLAVVVACGIYIGARILIPIAYEPPYLEALDYLPILLLKYILWSSYALVGAGLVGLGLMHYTFTVAAITTPISLAFTYYMLQRFDLIGVAWAQVFNATIILIALYTAMAIALRRKTASESL